MIADPIITETGHLWMSFVYNSIEYTLSYNYGLDITLISKYKEPDENDYCELVLVNYFHGGFNSTTFKPDDNILKYAVSYLQTN